MNTIPIFFRLIRSFFATLEVRQAPSVGTVRPLSSCVVISDSFKGSLSSHEICEIARACFAEALPDWTLDCVPVADGGEGTVDCFLEALPGKRVTVAVQGPFGEPVEASYALFETPDGPTAVIEMAAAAGLPLAEAAGRLDPCRASTYGVGQLMADALARGARHLVCGLGGSATNDGGCGCAAALGVRFLNERGEQFVPTGGTLDRIASIDVAPARELLDGARVTGMCDITAPLFGEQGAARVYAPQKGADEQTVELLDSQLRTLGDAIERSLGASVSQAAGAGAAGGMGAGLMAFLGAELKPGIECVLDLVRFEERAQGASLVVTGEGRLDAQTLQGKVVAGVARRAAALGVPVVALAGSVEPGAEVLLDQGLTAAFSVCRGPMTLEASCERAGELYRATLTNVLRLVRATERGAHSGKR